MVAVDDIERAGEADQAALFALYNAMREAGAALIVSGNAPPVQLPLRNDVITRLSWGLVYRIHALDDAEKAQALTDYAASFGFALLPDVCDYLLARSARDMASLFAFVRALDRYSLEEKRAVAIPLVRELLSYARSPGAPE